jgi:type III secretion protein C
MARLLGLEGVPAWTSPALAQATVSGRFRGRASQLFDELIEAYGLTWYFDGLTLHVYSLAEMDTQLIQLLPADVPRIESTLRWMGLTDARFPLRVVEEEGQVLVSGPPRFVQLVGEVIANLASRPREDEATTQVRVFRLRFARATDTTISIGGSELTVPGLAGLLQAVVAGAPAEARVEPRASSRTLPATQPGLLGKGLASQGRSTDAGSERTGSGSGAGGGASTRGAQSSSPNGNEGAAAATPARPKLTSEDFTRPTSAAAVPASLPPPSVSADPRINAVIVRDHPARMPMYERLIEELDVESPLVEIEATVIDVAQDKSEQLGVDWRASLGKLDALYSPNELGAPGNPSLDYSNDPRSVGRGLVGTLLVGSQRNFLLARVNALAESGDARLVSRPRVLTLNNSEAVLQSTSEFYVRVAGRDQVDLFNVSLGLSLRVTPTLYEQDGNRRFALQIRIEDGNTSTGAQVDQIPVVNRNTIATQAIVGDGQSLLIAGHVVERKQADNSGLPGLGRVPGLGWLFGQRASTDRRVERMFLITPKLVQPTAAPVLPTGGGAGLTPWPR